MPKLRSSKFGAPETKKLNKVKNDKKASRKVNRTHLAEGIQATQSPCQASPRLRRLVQDYSYADLVKMSDAKARALLVRAGVLCKDFRRTKCWECGAHMSVASSSSSGTQSSDTLRCCECPREKRRHFKQLKHSSLAWSVFWKGANRGYKPQFAQFLRFCFLCGVRTPQDTLQQILSPQDGVNREVTYDAWHQTAHLCLAFHEVLDQQKVVLRDEMVEVACLKLPLYHLCLKFRVWGLGMFP